MEEAPHEGDLRKLSVDQLLELAARRKPDQFTEVCKSQGVFLEIILSCRCSPDLAEG